MMAVQGVDVLCFLWVLVTILDKVASFDHNNGTVDETCFLTYAVTYVYLGISSVDGNSF